MTWLNGLRASAVYHKDAMTGIRDIVVAALEEKARVVDFWERALKLADEFDNHTAEQRMQYFAERLHNFPDAVWVDSDDPQTSINKLKYIDHIDVEMERAQLQFILAHHLVAVTSCFHASGSGLTS